MSTLLERIRPDLAAKRPPRKPAPEPTVDAKPAWLRRRDAGLLPPKVLVG